MSWGGGEGAHIWGGGLTGQWRRWRRALLGGLAEAQLPGVLVAVYGFADVDSLQVVCNFTADISAVRRAVEEEVCPSLMQCSTSLLCIFFGAVGLCVCVCVVL